MRICALLVVVLLGSGAACGDDDSPSSTGSPPATTATSDAPASTTTVATEPPTTTVAAPTSVVIEDRNGWRYDARISDVEFPIEFATPGKTGLLVTVRVKNLQADRHAPTVRFQLEVLVPKDLLGYCFQSGKEMTEDGSGRVFCSTGASVDADTLPSGNVIPAGEAVTYTLNPYQEYVEGLLSAQDVRVTWGEYGPASRVFTWLPPYGGAS